jgi:putative ABC transport system ATP-binding protein
MTTTQPEAKLRDAAAMPALEVRGVRKTFEAELAPVRALRGVDLTVERGTFIALMGPSGCGKSTLLNLIAGLEEVDEGSIVVAGEPMSEGSEDDHALIRRKHIGIVFQFFNLLEGMSVLENVALPAIIAGRNRKSAESRARDLLDLLGIADKASEMPGVLSGGQRQRLATDRSPRLGRRTRGHRTAHPTPCRRTDHHPGDARRPRRQRRRHGTSNARRSDRGR